MTTEETMTRKEYLARMREYKKTLTHTLATTRFNDATWERNVSCRKSINVACMYACPAPISKKVPVDGLVFVLEMNNEKNMIEGIGLIKNHAVCGKINPHDNMNYNRYIYLGGKHISRDEMTAEEKEIMRLLDALCFKGVNHLKRGQGITAFPLKLLYKCSANLNINEYIRNMFKSRMTEKETNKCTE